MSGVDPEDAGGPAHPAGRPLPGLPGLLGIELMCLTADHVEATLTVTPSHQVPDALHTHAGAVVTLADTVCGYGCRAALPEDAEGFITLELKTSLLRASLVGDRLICVGRPLHLGPRIQVWDAVVTVGDAHRLIASFRCTQLLL